MLVSKKWLCEYVDISEVPDSELSHTLTSLGLEVEGITTTPELDDKLVVGQILSAERHPNADTLQVCLVDIGTGNPLSIVCGAANARKGIKVIVAQVGVTLPGNFKIKESKIRGEKSFGMLCSEEELGTASKSEGILELSGDKTIGTKVNSFIKTGDSVFEIGLTPNRSDCNGIIGIARDLSAKTGKKLKYPPVHQNPTVKELQKKAKSTLERNSGCDRLALLYIQDLEISESPEWLKKRIEAAGIRPINQIVDITNYVMLEMNQPIHAYDAKFVNDLHIIVRSGTPNEVLITLDGKEVKLTSDDIVISDSRGPIGLAGIMGGRSSEISNSTTDIIIEVASFDPARIRRTAKRFSFHTDASHRFERGIDIENIPHVAKRVGNLIEECASQLKLKTPKITYEVVDSYPKPIARPRIALRLERARKVLGLITLNSETCIKHLTSLEFKLLDQKDERLLFEAPLWRVDVTREIDLIEEVARLESFDKIPYRIPTMEIAPTKENPFISFVDEAKSIMAITGLSEVITYPFTSKRDYESLLISESHPLFPTVELANPLVSDDSWMQTNGLPGLLKAILRNHRHQKTGSQLFEVGKGFHDFSIKSFDRVKFPVYGSLDRKPLHFSDRAQGETGRPIERHIATFILDYPYQKKGWNWKEERPTFFDGKAIVEALMKCFGITGATYRRPQANELPFLHPSASAVVMRGIDVLGWLGELHPKVAKNFEIDLNQIPVVCELELEAIYAATIDKLKIKAAQFEFPPACRDLAFTVAKHISHGDILNSFHSFNRKKHLERMEIFDVFHGGQISADRKSMAYSLQFRSPGKTLTDQEVEKEYNSFVEWLSHELGAEKR